jgi:hypothetical protein
LKWVTPYREKLYKHFFCSRFCQGKALSLKKKEKATHYKGGKYIPCEVCGKKKWYAPYQVARQKHFFCSTSCMGKWNGKNQAGKKHPNWSQVKTKCAYCKKSITKPMWYFKAKKHHFCSPECTSNWRSEQMLGENHFAWNGGTSNDPYPFDWEATAKRIRERDSYTCQRCGEFGNHVHHLDGNKMNCNDENLTTLCCSCHPIVERQGRVGLRNGFVRLLTSA